MYLAVVVLLMGVFPLGSILIEGLLRGGADPMLLVGKWFVFWSVGVRLVLAGMRQAIHPVFTAETIFEVRDRAALPIVRELGFGNLSIGLLGLASLVHPSWVAPAAMTGGLFYGLAGALHMLKTERNRVETIAMISDLFLFVVLAVFLLVEFPQR